MLDRRGDGGLISLGWSEPSEGQVAGSACDVTMLVFAWWVTDFTLEPADDDGRARRDLG